MSDSEYEEANDVEHVLLKPDMYIGNIDKNKRKAIIYKNGKMTKSEIDIPEGMEKVIVEILENAVDNKEKSIEDGYDPKHIEVTMIDNEISVKNYGRPISLKKRKDGLYNPEFVFGKLRSGSNLNKKGNKKRKGKGTNGLGSKLTVIYSKVFQVEVADAKEGKYFKKIWRKNMTTSDKTIIEKYKEEDSYVKITFILDMKRFGYSRDYKYDETFIDYVRTRCIHLAFTDRIPFEFNDEYYEFDIKSYSKLFLPKNSRSAIISSSKDPSEVPKYELVVYYTPDKGNIISFCNGILTTQGGLHVDKCFEMFKEITKEVNKDNNDLKITLRHIKMHISLIVSVHVDEPKCTGQMKEKMTGPNVDIEIPKNIIKTIKSWGIIDKLKGVIDDSISSKVIKKTDGKKVKNIGKFKGAKANKAGGKHSKDCILYAVEGDTAEDYARNIRSFTPNGTDLIGTFPLRGKILNSRKHTLREISECEEINNLKKVLGLVHGKDYSKDLSSLRYGKIRILTDADDDGYHIACLLINLFDHLFPGITKNGFIELFETPVVRACKGKQMLPFYTVNEYNKWKRDNTEKGWKIKYYKGLGSSGPKETKEDLKTNRIIKFSHDSNTNEALEIAFNPSRVDERKDKILNLRIKDKNFKQNVKISDYLNTRLIMYWRSNIVRSIPQLVDGFKESVRKIFWAVWQILHLSNVKVNTNRYKLSQVIFEACKISDYHKGDSSVDKIIKKMCLDYVGTNNLPFFKGKGNFGGRSEGPAKTGSSRYLFIKANEWVKYVFRKEDLEILEYNLGDKGEPVEPKFYLPIIPIGLVNGCKGVGSGWSTEVTKHNALDVINYIRNLIQDKKTKRLKPYFVNFTGEINRHKGGFNTTGRFSVKDNIVTIEELPIGMWYKTYENNFIIGELEEKNIISGYDDNCKRDNKTFIENINFKIKFKSKGDAKVQTHKSLRLISNFSYSNMYLLNEDNVPVKYDTIDEIIYNFYIIRLRYYDVRKESQIKTIQSKIDKLAHKIKLILLIVEKKIIIVDRLRQEVAKDVESYGIPVEVYIELKGTCLSRDDIERYKREIKKLKEQLRYVVETDVKDVWLDELKELEDYILKYHNVF